MKPHDLIYATDLTGLPVVGVLLSNLQVRAWLFRIDYEMIVAKYGTPKWRLASNGSGRAYVRFKLPGDSNHRVLTVARLVAGDYKRTAVRYRDNDPLNLRVNNLHHDDGGGRCPKRPKGGVFNALCIQPSHQARG